MPSFLQVDGAVLHYAHRSGEGAGVVLLNSLGTDLRIWEEVARALPPDRPLLMCDKRGHGLSQTAPAVMQTYAHDVAALMEACAMGPALVVGVSIGGMIAQSLAVLRPDLVAGLVLSNTGAKIGARADWDERLGTLAEHGLGAMSDAVLERWFAKSWRDANPAALEGYRAMLSRTPAKGYAVACEAIRDADLREAVGRIDVPTLCIAGSDDPATPPDVVRDLAGRIPGADYAELDGVGHLPCIEAPERMAELVRARLP